ncbi:hypothetical protein O181_064160 [Austropuccinia psidii MF-1]|uniref:Uncharacterized protein n=1 Tax=Austropuccinia psidii MF-1 TaxID=1389203 RepID=A0A9Q3EK11_9BASI|nr:hypothetical protein [Austropuccinia psidii MF-1]
MVIAFSPQVLEAPLLFYWKEAMSTSRSATSHCQRILVEQGGWAFWERAPVSEAPTPDGTSGYSIWVVKRIRKISDSPTNPDSEGSEELDVEEVEMINLLVGHPSSSSPTQPPCKKFHSNLISSTPSNFQPVLSSLPYSVPPPSPKPSTSRPILASPALTSHQLQRVSSTS